jgi:capsular polysaccharide biosynthesis protein
MARSSNETRQIVSWDDEIDLLDLFYYLKRKIVLIVLLFLAGMLVSGLYTKYRITPTYTATAKLYVASSSGSNIINLEDLNLGTQLSSDYVELLKTRPVCEEVIRELGLSYSYSALRGMYTITCVSSTRILQIDVVSTSPEEARDIANTLAEKAVDYLPKVMDMKAPSVIEEAVVPAYASSPSMSKNVMRGGLLAAALVIGILTVLYLMDDTVKSSEDIEKLTGVMPLTVIPEDGSRRGGAKYKYGYGTYGKPEKHRKHKAQKGTGS